MRNIVNIVQYIFTAIGGAMGWLFGGMDGFLYVLITFVIFDYITGVMVAFIEQKISSEVGFKGICRKVVIFCFVGMGHVLDVHIIKTGNVLRTAVIFFYLSNEGISIIENATLLGLPVPEKIKDVLEQLRNDSDTKE